MSNTLPPVSLSKWLDQFNDDPLIPAKYKNGAECQLKVYDTTFRSGSDLNSTENLHLRTICHKYIRIESLGDLMRDDGDRYAGFVSAENMRKASRIFHTKRHKWQNYLDELAARASEEERSVATRNPGHGCANGIRVPYTSHPVRPSMDHGDPFWNTMHHQLLTTTSTSKDAPTSRDFERTSNTVKFGYGAAKIYVPTAVNREIPPSTPMRARQLAIGTTTGSTQSTPDVASYYPARGGKSNKPANDETYVNMALLEFLQTITVVVGQDFSSLDWLAARLAFKLTESVTKTGLDGRPFEETRKLMEARVDGYLCRKYPDDRELNNTALAILEVKPFTLLSALSATRRQQGAEMACWISQDPNTFVGLLQSSKSGRERRLMISQHRHEIYFTVAEYGAGFKKHIRPSRTIVQGRMEDDVAESGNSSPSSTTADRGSSTEADDSSTDLGSTPIRRNPALLAGSPSHISVVERKGIKVAADPQGTAGKVQLTRPAPGMEEWPSNDERWTPDAGDFLIMHEFGPFSTKSSDHMDVFMKRFIAFSLQLRGPLRGFFPATTEAAFLGQSAAPVPSALSEPSCPGRNLRKSRSWQPQDSDNSEQGWQRPYTKWQG